MSLRKRFTKALSIVLTLGMVAGSVPPNAYAAEPSDGEGQESAVDLTDGLLGHWTFDGGGENDAWLNNAITGELAATKTGAGVSLSADGGISGGGVAFDGTERTYLTLPLGENGPKANTKFSIGAWVKYNARPNANQSVLHLDGTTGQALLTAKPSDDKLQYGTFLGGGITEINAENQPERNSVYSSKTVSAEKWHHVMAVFDTAAEKAHFYINGKDAGTLNLINRTDSSDNAQCVFGNGNIRVGCHRNDQNTPAAINGVMDEIRYYGKAITAEMAEAIYLKDATATEISADLEELIAEAEALTGDTQNPALAAAIQKLTVAIQKAQDLKDSNADKDALLAGIAALKQAMDDYQNDVSNGLVGHWTFDGSETDNAWLNSAVTENLKAAKTTTGVSLSQDGGYLGGGASFDGTDDTYLTLDLNSASATIDENTGSFSIGAWVKYDTLTATSLFHMETKDGAGHALLALGERAADGSEGGGHFRYNTFLGGGSASGTPDYSETEIEANTWHHVMIVFMTAENKAEFYLNGTLSDELPLGATKAYGNGNIRVGCHRNGGAAIDGIVDEIRYYDKAVTAKTVKAIYDEDKISLLKDELEALLSDADKLTGGTGDSEQALAAAKDKANALLDETAEVTIESLEDAKTALCEAISSYTTGGSGDDPVVEPNGLAGHWTFDGGGENDAWLNNVITSEPAATKTANGVSLSANGGISGGGASFNGTNDTYLTLPLGNKGPNNSMESFSIGAWVKYNTLKNASLFHMEGTDSGHALLALGDRGEDGEEGGGRFRYNTFLGGGSVSGTPDYSETEIEADTWHHVMIVFRTAENKAKLYVNGKLTDELPLGANKLYGNGNIRVGCHRADHIAIDGIVDEIRYYNTAVTAATVKEIYNRYGLPLEINALKAELTNLITQADALSGGTDDSVSNLNAAVSAAQALLDGTLAVTEETIASLTEKKDALKEAIDNYRTEGSGDDPAVVPAGLAGYWTFDGNTDTDRLASKAGAANLVAEKNGTGVTASADGGVAGGAVTFTGDNNSFLKLKLAEAGKGLSAANAFTVGAWIKYDSDMASNDGISVFHQDGEDAGRAILMIGNGGSNGIKYGTYLGASDEYAENKKAEKGKWHHVMISVAAGTGAGRKANIYVNGELANDAAGLNLAGALVDGSGDIRVGSHRQNSNSIKGVMDEIFYYERALNADDVKKIYDVYGEQIETENLRAELRQMITAARALTGGTAAAQTALDNAIAEAEDGLDTANLATLKEKKTALQEAVDTYKENAPVSIAVDTADVLRTIPSSMFGINHRYHNYGYGTWDKDNEKIYDQFNELAKEVNFGSVRYPGGTVSNLFTWKDSIGPKEDRTPTIGGNNFYGGEVAANDPAFGVDEAMTWIYDELGSEAIFVYGFGRGNSQDAADLVEYLNAPNDGSNPNGGTDWAAVRAKNGHEEPYGVTRFEIGNEILEGSGGQEYWMSGTSQNDKSLVDLYIEGDTMAMSGQGTLNQQNNRVSKKGDWRPSASRGDGTANQERYVFYAPVVEGSATVTVGGTEWTVVDSLEDQGAENVCAFEYETGKITFGDGAHGNKPDDGAEIRCNYQTRQEGFVNYYAAMKAVAEDIGMEIEIYSGLVHGKQNEFIEKMHDKGYDDKYDGVIIHSYSNNVTSYAGSLVSAKNYANDIQTYKTKMDTTAGAGTNKKVALSEFGILSVSPASNYQSSLGHAIYIANEMIDCVNSGVAYMNKHCLVDTAGASDNLGNWQQCVIQTHTTDKGYQYVSTPSARLLSIFNNMTGGIEVNQEITGNDVFTGTGNNAVHNLNVYSTKDEYGNTYVLAVNNKENDAVDVSISIDGQDLTGKEIDVWYLASENVGDVNTLVEPDKIAVQKETVTGSQTSIAYTLKAHSVYSFKLKASKTSVTVTAGENGTASAGQTDVVPGDKVTVTAEPDSGYLFAGWFAGNKRVSSEKEYTFQAPKDGISLEARFGLPAQITVNTEGEDSGGRVIGGQTAAVGSEITVKAIADEGYVFIGWYNNGQKVSGDAKYTFEVTEAMNIIAKFTLKGARVSVTVIADGDGGTVSGGSDEAVVGQEITVTATPKDGYEFIGWYNGENIESTDAAYTFIVTETIELTAIFERLGGPLMFYVTVKAEAGGTAEGPAAAEAGSKVTVEATANAGYEFAGWYDGGKKVSGSASYTFTAEKDITLTAKFTKKEPVTEKVKVTVKANAGGTASGTAEVTKGANVTVKATANAGYEFAGWHDGGKIVSTAASYTFEAVKNITLTATFKQKAAGGGNEEVKSFSSGKFNYQILDKTKKTVSISGIVKKTKNAKTLTIPATVKSGGVTYKVVRIGAKAFANCKKLTKVTIGANVTAIEKKAFSGCKKLSKITLKGKALKTVKSGAFKNTSKKLTVTAKKVKKSQRKKLQKTMRKGGNKKLKVK